MLAFSCTKDSKRHVWTSTYEVIPSMFGNIRLWCMRNFIYKITFAFLIISCGTKEVAKKDPLDLAISDFIETYYDEDKEMILDASKSSRDLYFLDDFRLSHSRAVYLQSFHFIYLF